jgi:hypothetical protein
MIARIGCLDNFSLNCALYYKGFGGAQVIEKLSKHPIRKGMTLIFGFFIERK